LVIVTEHGRKGLTKPMLDSFDELARERIEASGGRLIAANGEPEPVPLVFTLPPQFAQAGSSRP
jgi:hypothetical protein